MVYAIQEKTDKRRGEREQQGRCAAARGPPNAKAHAKGEEKTAEDETQVPRPRGAVRQNRDELQRVAEHRLALCEQRVARIVVAIPQRQFAVLEQRPAFDRGEG